jgi:hypothetical protein
MPIIHSAGAAGSPVELHGAGAANVEQGDLVRNSSRRPA